MAASRAATWMGGAGCPNSRIGIVNHSRFAISWSLLLTVMIAASLQAAPHDKAYWAAIVAARYAVPPDESPFALARELSGLLGSPDPELRN